MAGHNELNSVGQFYFIPSQSSDDRTTRRLGRSHAVARGIQNKRKLEQKSGLNFHAVSLEHISRPASNRKQRQALIMPSDFLSAGPSDPFQMLAAESPRLQALFDQREILANLKSIQGRLTRNEIDKAQYATKPTFSVSDELVLQNFRSFLREGLDDHALLSAIMLTYAYATTAGSIDRECLRYQGEVLSAIRQRMSSPNTVTKVSTLGAILLLAGIEARLGLPRQVQLHMGAIKQLLDVCRRTGVYLSDGIKRAIFWSDLNASVMTGSSRVVDHTTFSELQWRRDPFSPSYFILPPGFQSQSYLLDRDFVEVLKDVSALQCIRDSALFSREDVISMAHIDNHQASIQSRLMSLPTCSLVAECCHLAAYLCSTMLRCRIWRASTIPSHLSLQLLCKLQQANDDSIWDGRPGLLAWLLHIGGSFAPLGTIRSEYVALLQINRRTRLRGLYTSWPELLEILKQFIWSDKAFMSQVKAFWEEIVV
ncbi:N-ethylmaleimide reductase [Penicillium frequentans]|uniref:N-ethylmaleimide reductase n=1 Tax=Penicillium frequentans TaxID=3151616 RepID=A0AAD6G8N9_9EURO|nr:N-ethylmaleimide reductase [Penicillium glabrum]